MSDSTAVLFLVDTRRKSFLFWLLFSWKTWKHHLDLFCSDHWGNGYRQSEIWFWRHCIIAKTQKYVYQYSELNMSGFNVNSSNKYCPTTKYILWKKISYSLFFISYNWSIKGRIRGLSCFSSLIAVIIIHNADVIMMMPWERAPNLCINSHLSITTSMSIIAM